MSTWRLDRIFSPRSVALVGASPRTGSLGQVVLRNLRRGGFAGSIGLVNPRHAEIDGQPCAKRLEDLSFVPDLAVIATPPASVPDIIARAGRHGVAAVVVITAGLGHGSGSLADRVRAEARRHGLRVVGPNCFGVIAPAARLNASFAARQAAFGDLALISQSGAVEAGLIEWAARRGAGFSALVSLGDMVDVDFADCLDHFAADGATRAIVLYIESVADARKFMSAARAAARVKPVVVIKAGRHAEGARAAATHTGALAGSDAVYDAAFRRAGLLRVFDLDELFAATEILSRQPPFPGRRLAILTNGGGIGVLAVDRLADLGGTLAGVSAGTAAALARAMPRAFSPGNPVDIIGDADAARYALALEALLVDGENDAVLVLNVPTGLAPSSEAAGAVAGVVEEARRRGGRAKPVLAVWLGEDEASRVAFAHAGIPQFETEADAVRGFVHLVRYREGQDLLLETPDSVPKDFAPDAAGARAIIARVLEEGREWLDPLEVSSLMAAYGIPAAPVVRAASPQEAAVAARPILAAGGTVAVKILSADIVHKSDVGGVALDLAGVEAVRAAAAAILERAARRRPDARIAGVTVQPMIRRPKARELIIGLADDPTFGPVVVFGRGGTAVEVIDDKALALPPLDLKLARLLIARTRVARVLGAWRDVPAADEAAIRLALVKVSQLAADLAEVRELDINPLLADEAGIIAVDARVRVAAVPAGPPAARSRFAVRPYPKEWERTLTLKDGRSLPARPIRPDDEALFQEFARHVSAEDLRLRFFAPVREFSHAFLARFLHLDYARAIAFVALDPAGGQMLGSVRLHADPNHETAEFAILVRTDVQGQGLGWALMKLMLEWAAADGIAVVEGEVLRENEPMLAMSRALGFTLAPDPETPTLMRVRLRLAGQPGGGHMDPGFRRDDRHQ
jgi:acetyltransferase